MQKPLSFRLFGRPWGGRVDCQTSRQDEESITINGTLDYQACDDAIYYNPVSLPLSWTVSLRPLVFQRPER